MLRFLPPPARGLVALFLLVLNTLGWCAPLFVLSLAKLFTPSMAARARIDGWLNTIATGWIACNGGWMRLTQRTDWDAAGLGGLRPDGWYLVNANHQSWVDIFVLQRLLNRRIPLLKFFLKQELIYVPVIGLAWWALDFPFMKRHSRAALASNPALRNEDRDTARRACAKFARIPTSVMNFAEGTRFTAAKHAAQASPHRHLLMPKAGALAVALDALGERFRALLDVTIVYPAGAPTFWQFLCGTTPRIVVRIHECEIPPEFLNADYANDPAFRQRFREWLGALWSEKDTEIDRLLREPRETIRAMGG